MTAKRSLHLAPRGDGLCLRWTGSRRSRLIGSYDELLAKALRVRDEQSIRVVAHHKDGTVARTYE